MGKGAVSVCGVGGTRLFWGSLMGGQNFLMGTRGKDQNVF